MGRVGARLGPAARLFERLPLLAETFVSDGEHRAIWGGPPVRAWQIALTATLVAAGAACALLPSKHRDETSGAAAWRRGSALTLVVFTATMLFSRMNVTEHHLVTAVPVAAVAAVLGFRRIGVGSRAALPAIAGAAALWGAVAVSWDVRAAEGLRVTGGRGDWSDAIEDVAATLRREAPGDEARALRWGLANNVFVLSRGTVRMRELFWGATEAGPFVGSWADEIRGGGLFLSGRGSSLAEDGFRRALAASGQPYRKWTFRQRDGALYAELFRILPAPPTAPTPSPSSARPGETSASRDRRASSG